MSQEPSERQAKTPVKVVKRDQVLRDLRMAYPALPQEKALEMLKEAGL